MTAKQKLDVIIYGIKIKIKRGEILEDILAGYIKLTDEEKDYIRKNLTGGEKIEE